MSGEGPHSKDTALPRSMPEPPHNAHKGKTGLRRVWNAFFYSMAGLKAAYAHEDAFRQEVWLAVVLVPLALYLTPDAVERALMIGSVLLVLIVELINSAIEATVDRISLKDHVLAKRAKDIGSASVFMALVNVVVIWVLLLVG
ncbi:MAG: diacylglycerol kinase [Burkholderiales bacterium]|nr:diacylglycerol kinase [Burkholderiales bacterium]